jgi:putative ABC transport system permease protein
MNGILLMVRRSLRQHALSTSITLLSVALATGLVMSVFGIQKQSYDAFTGGAIGYDAVLGAKGSQLQLVLNTVFHLETSPGNIPYTLYQQMIDDPRVELAIPYAMGDNYYGFRIVGTTTEMFTDFEYQEGKKYQIGEEGRPFEAGYAEAVLGSIVAEQTGLKVGDHFNPTHGIKDDDLSHDHEEEYTVVGIMAPTNTPNDRIVWIPIEGVYWMGGHVLRGAGELYTPEGGTAIPDEHKEVSAVMLNFKNPKTGFDLDMAINKQGKEATLAYPIATVMADLFNKVGWANRILEVVAYLVVVVSGAAILASIYNTINERRREFAILRALGARKTTVFTVIVIESATIAGLGSILGFLVYGIIMYSAAVVVRQQTGVVIDPFSIHPMVWITPLGMIAIGAFAGVIPAIKAYQTDVADNLIPHS